MELTANQLNKYLKGKIEGNPAIKINKVAKIQDADKGSVSFIANPKYIPFIYSTNASVVVVENGFTPEKPISPTLIRVKDSYKAFSTIMSKFNGTSIKKTGTEQPVFIAENVELGNNFYIGAFTYIGCNSHIGDNVKIFPQVYIGDNVTIGDNTTIYTGVKIDSDCKVGKKCIIHSGVVIGSDGFGFTPQANGSYNKIVQSGNVIIEDNVEIGANTTIDRATLGSTIIRNGVKLDNLIQIAHNVEIGENTVIAAQTGVAGSTKIGKECMIGGQVGIVGHITIADCTKIGAQSGVGSSITEKGTTVLGSPAFSLKEHIKSFVLFKNLPELNNRVKEIERKVEK